jgi:hypothetical protein
VHDAVAREREAEPSFANSPAEALDDQQFEVGLVIDHENWAVIRFPSPDGECTAIVTVSPGDGKLVRRARRGVQPGPLQMMPRSPIVMSP